MKKEILPLSPSSLMVKNIIAYYCNCIDIKKTINEWSPKLDTWRNPIVVEPIERVVVDDEDINVRNIILDEVCKCFSLSHDDLMGPYRKTPFHLARYFYYHYCSVYTDLVQEEISVLINRNRSGVSQSKTHRLRVLSLPDSEIEKIDFLKYDKKIKDALSKILIKKQV